MWLRHRWPRCVWLLILVTIAVLLSFMLQNALWKLKPTDADTLLA